jgi:Rrf2 family transcriptional regulator, nitric oxide-sensitive transcriptional repressor
MRLTVLSDYSLRVLMYLGIHDDRLCTISEIAQAYGISENHLMKVVNRLGQDGFIETMRGRGGGLRLAKPPGSVSLAEVLRATEEDFQLVECFGEEDTCRITGTCRLKHALRRALQAYFAELDAWTLADIVSNRRALNAALS